MFLLLLNIKKLNIPYFKNIYIFRPSPLRPGSVDRLACMSPAARRLATSKLGLGLSNAADLSLRASYSPSPKNRNLRPQTPNTPRVLSNSDNKPVTPKLGRVSNNLTDNLLNISLPKRHKASDFF